MATRMAAGVSIRLVFLLLANASLLACTKPEEASDDTVILGLIVPFDLHRSAADGAALAADEINAAGGLEVGGRRKQLKVLVEDSERRSETAVSKALQLINRERAVALLGLPRSVNAIPVAKIAEQNRVPLISTMSTHPETTAGKRYVWRLAFLNAFQGRVLADFAFDDLGARRAAALVAATDTYSTDLAEVFRQAFEDRGGQIVAFETFTEDDMDVTTEMQRIRASDAEVLLMPYYVSMVKLHAAVARRSGVAATFLGSDSWSMMLDPRDRVAVQGAYFSDYWAPDQETENAKPFIDSFRRRFAAAPSASAALAYDAVTLIATAIRDRGASDPESIRAGLASIEDFRGVTGTIAFVGSGDPVRSTFIRRIDADGKIRLHKELRPGRDRPGRDRPGRDRPGRDRPGRDRSAGSTGGT